MRIYKYSSKRHALRLARYGCFRIGTLYEYRDDELHKSGIADLNEGTKTIHGVINEHFKSGTDIPKNLAQLGIISADDSSSNITMTNVSFESKINSSNAYIWCASLEKSRTVQNQFENADSCVEIFDTRNFVNALDKYMQYNYNVIYKGLHVITYNDRRGEWNKEHLGTHPALIKETMFAKQKEVRAIWEPIRGANISPIIGDSIQLTKYCKLTRIK